MPCHSRAVHSPALHPWAQIPPSEQIWPQCKCRWACGQCQLKIKTSVSWFKRKRYISLLVIILGFFIRSKYIHLSFLPLIFYKHTVSHYMDAVVRKSHRPWQTELSTHLHVNVCMLLLNTLIYSAYRIWLLKLSIFIKSLDTLKCQQDIYANITTMNYSTYWPIQQVAAQCHK